MKISELKTRQDNVNIEAVVRDIDEPRSFDKFGRELRVANATIDDGSGSIKLTLWNQDIDKVAVGNKIKVTNGFVNEFNGEKRLTSGRIGKIEVIEKGTFEQVEEVEKAEEQVEQAEEVKSEEEQTEKAEEVTEKVEKGEKAEEQVQKAEEVIEKVEKEADEVEKEEIAEESESEEEQAEESEE